MSDTPASVFNTHAEIIAAPPELIWPLFLDRSRWMESFVSRTLVGGTEGRRGAIADVVMKVQGSAQRREETLHEEPGARLVVRITAKDSSASAHADFELQALEQGCRLQVSIHTWLSEARPPDSLSVVREATQAKISTDFARLRAVAELASSASSR